ncbi:MAG: 2-hydroxyacid dehydrogenase [Gammaproteobacteria bacterium]|nr:2-hydroxyacid dehydrogenase [Gammaproteobacteria bacterium]
MTTIKAVALDMQSIDRDDLSLEPLCNLPFDWTFHDTTTPDETGLRIEQAEVVISNKVILSREILQQAKELKLICIAATGTNNVDLDAARELGIAVSNVTAYATAAVVQHTFTLILSLTTHLQHYSQEIAEGAWQKSDQFFLLDQPIRELDGLTLGIVGYGELGRGAARLGKAFGMKVMIAQRPGGEPGPDRLPLDQLLPQVDILSLHCPLADNTRGMIGSDELALMKPDALLINTARGGVVDEQALADALRGGRLGGAGFDVLTTEPPRDGNPLLASDIPNLIVTPHIAWATRQARQRVIDEIAENVQAFIESRNRNRVA